MVRFGKDRRALPTCLIVLVLALAILTPALAGTRATAQEQDAAMLLQKAAATMAAAQSFHVTLTTPRGKSMIADQIELAGIEGDIQRPDRFQASFTAKASIVSLTIKVIGIGSRIWVTDPMQREETWIEVTAGSEGAVPLPDLLNPDRLLAAAVALIQQPAITGEDEIDGTKTTRVEGIFDPRQVNQFAGTPVPELTDLTSEKPIPVTIWIADDGRVPRIEFQGPLTAAESNDVVRRLDVTKFNQPVDIQPPA
jgi:hypothetical protein